MIEIYKVYKFYSGPGKFNEQYFQKPESALECVKGIMFANSELEFKQTTNTEEMSVWETDSDYLYLSIVLEKIVAKP